MFKALLKKQIKETLGTYTAPNAKRKKKNGEVKTAGKAGKYWFIILYVFVIFSLGMAFIGLGHLLGEVLIPLGYDWLYFAMIGVMGLALGVIGSVFGLYSSVYKAKDNETLLSMPIPPKYIVLVRLIASWIVALIMEATAFIPAIIVYLTLAEASMAKIICWIVMIFAASFICLALTCLIGWIVAIVSSRVKNKSIATTLTTIVLLGAYYVFYFNINNLLAKLVENILTIGGTIQKNFYPLYAYGKAFTGDWTSMLIMAAIAAVLFMLVYVFISRSFISITTINKGGKKTNAKKAVAERSDIRKTLLRREFKHLIDCASYMTNCALGTLLMAAGAVVLVIKASDIKPFLDLLPMMLGDYAGLAAVAVVLLVSTLTSMNDLTAPSISLEGENFWILRSMPLDMNEVIKAKIKMHLILTLPPLALVLAAAEYVFSFSAAEFVLIALGCAGFVFLEAYGGIAANIKMPRMDWVNETSAVKQSGSVVVALFGGWAVCIVEGAACYFLRDAMSSTVMLVLIAVLNIAAVAWLASWLKNKGSKMLDGMQC